MKKYFANDYNDIYKAILLMYLVNITNILTYSFNINLPLLRYFFAMTGVFYFLKGIYFTHRNLKLSSQSIRYSFYALVLVTFVMIARGMPVIWEGNEHYINLKLFISGQLFIYLIPFIVFVEPNIYLIKKIFRLSYLLSIIYLLITLPLYGYFTKDVSNDAEYFGVLFAAGSSIILLTLFYHSSKVRGVAIFTFLLVLFINLILARRNQVIYFSSIPFFFFLIHMLSKSSFVKKRKPTFILGFILASFLIFIYLYVSISKFTYFYEKTQTGLGSREYVIGKFFEDFDVHPNDYIYGRGINGVFIAGTTGGANTITGERELIENGYLQHILVGGWIYLGLILLISLRAMYLGFFKSRNILTKAFAAIILTYLFDMVGFALPALTLKHFMIWMGISVCYSAKIRNFSDEYLKSVVGLK